MFYSVLFGGTPPPDVDSTAVPACFRDLNLDQITESATARHAEYSLKPYFYVPLAGLDSIAYRHEVFRDLEDKTLLAQLEAFAAGMRRMREHLATAKKLHSTMQLHYILQEQCWFAEAVAAYCDAVSGLAASLDDARVASRGLAGFHGYLATHVRSDSFTSLVAETAGLRADLSRIVYCLHIKGNRIRVSKYNGEDDYCQEVLATFEKFRQGAVRDYRVQMPIHQVMNHVEAGVLGLVAKLYPETFAALGGYRERHSGYQDDTIARFDREIQFYLAYLGYIRPLQTAGLPFCYPLVSADSKEVHARDTFDLALASKLASEHARVVTNDLSLRSQERVLVVTGPNQGGKTTLARTFGQLHHLGRLGCPVPGRDVRLFGCDELFTHFGKEEDLATLSGKLQDDLVRFRGILDRATSASVIIMNEIFTSTTLDDALFLGAETLSKITELGALCVCVTFLDELASLNPACVSMVATVVPENPAVRTYKVVRKPADGLAYAMAIAAQHGLTYDQLTRRLGS
jgi:DNA mismatch repair protein MutS